MNNFKVGDKVRCIERSDILIQDKIYTISKISSNPDLIYVDKLTGGWFPRRFELVKEEKEFKDIVFVSRLSRIE